MTITPVAPVAAAVAVGLLELAGSRRSGLGKGVGVDATRPELRSRQLGAVDEFLVTEADRERDDLDPEFVGDVDRKVARTVGHDVHGRGGG